MGVGGEHGGERRRRIGGARNKAASLEEGRRRDGLVLVSQRSSGGDSAPAWPVGLTERVVAYVEEQATRLEELAAEDIVAQPAQDHLSRRPFREVGAVRY